ncbi:MAG: YaaR family protein [Nanoarchaeota archaeon]
MQINNKKIKSNINSNSKLNREKIRTESKGKGFNEYLTRINQTSIKKRLDKLLNIVDEQGEKLKNSLDKKDLWEYKKRVQDFLRMIQKEFVRAKQSYSWDDSGQVKTYTIIEKVDQKLDELHNLFIKEQADVLQIVNQIDEIRGLLLDIYQ